VAGDGSTATVNGNDSAGLAIGEGNTAIVDGDGSTASASADDGCVAQATGDRQTVACP
jgi:hypothetical protein